MAEAATTPKMQLRSRQRGISVTTVKKSNSRRQSRGEKRLSLTCKKETLSPLSKSADKRTKQRRVPNFAKIHAEAFSKMKSITEYANQNGSAVKTSEKKRANEGCSTSKKNSQPQKAEVKNAKKKLCFQSPKPSTKTTKSQQMPKAASLELAVPSAACFSFTTGAGHQKKDVNPKAASTRPKDKAKQKVMEKSKECTVQNIRSRNKEILKGVRMNRHFMLVMKRRGINLE